MEGWLELLLSGAQELVATWDKIQPQFVERVGHRSCLPRRPGQIQVARRLQVEYQSALRVERRVHPATVASENVQERSGDIDRSEPVKSEARCTDVQWHLLFATGEAQSLNSRPRPGNGGGLLQIVG